MSPPMHPSAEALARALTRVTSPPVQICESSVAWVLLAGDRAYRLHKRVRTPSADLVSFEGRLRACRAVRDADRTLGADVVLDVRAVVRVGDSFVLAREGHPDAVDHVVEMRRVDERPTLGARAKAGDLPAGAADAVGRRVAAFHAGAPAMTGGDVLTAARAGWHAAVDRMSAGTRSPLPPRRMAAIERFSGAFARARTRQLRDRAGAGQIRDGHGDLRASHVLLDPVMLTSREVYDLGLRRVDVGDDLSALLMDLDRRGAREAAARVVDGYRDAGGDPGDGQLLAFWGARRALVAATRSPSGGGEAREYAELAERLVWQARGPVALVVCGGPRDGRARVAAALARRTGWPVLTEPGDADADSRPASVVIEHPLADGAAQRTLVGRLRHSGRQPRVLECRSGADPRPVVATDVPARHRLVVDPEGDVEDMLDAVATWLDASLRDLAPRTADLTRS